MVWIEPSGERITCWASELRPGSSRDCNMAWGRWCFYRETKGSRGREWANERKTP